MALQIRGEPLAYYHCTVIRPVEMIHKTEPNVITVSVDTITPPNLP